MNAKNTRRPRSFWEATVREHSTSGLSIRDFATRKGLPVSTLYQWARRLPRNGPRFVEVKTVPTTSASSAVRLVIGSVRVELAELPPVAYLAALALQTAAL